MEISKKKLILAAEKNVGSMTPLRKYPVGIQSFESIRTGGYIYVDKTPLIYKIINEGKHYFLSRPRRFGKSLLCSTLEAVFQGRRNLFEAFTTEAGICQPQLFIATTNWKWDSYPVIRFDFSWGTEYTLPALKIIIDFTLASYERKYGIVKKNDEGSNTRFITIIEEAHRQTGRPVVVLVDEYDSYLLHCIGDKELESAIRTEFSNLFSPLKSLDDHLQFVFITGISKFSQMGIFSTLNNLNNISMAPDYDALCGITEEELSTQLQLDIKLLAGRLGQTYDETFANLKQMYDGYHFSRHMTDIYNPFSLLNAFSKGEFSDYWFDSATPSSVINMLAQIPPIELTDIDGVVCPAEDFDVPFDSYSNPLPVLYQSGYLTIKDYRLIRNSYTLGLPNSEVRRGFANSLYRYVVAVKGLDTNKNVFLQAYYDFFESDDLPAFIEAIKVFFAGIPYYLEGKDERHYHAILYTLLTAFGADISAEEPSAKGRADIILKMPKGIYVIEIKYDDTADNAIKQIDQRGYADKYRLDGRPVTKVGISFSSKERNITEWKKMPHQF